MSFETGASWNSANSESKRLKDRKQKTKSKRPKEQKTKRPKAKDQKINDLMTKYEVLAAFAESGDFLKPDDLQARFKPRPDRRSVYSYLLRLASQGLLERPPKCRRGSLAYRLTDRGYARLKYFRQRHLPGP